MADRQPQVRHVVLRISDPAELDALARVVQFSYSDVIEENILALDRTTMAAVQRVCRRVVSAYRDSQQGNAKAT